jgi:hypothetical protein
VGDVSRDQIPGALKASLIDPAKLCRELGLAEKSKRQARGVSILCPVHGEKTPSCSVTLGPDGTIRVRCFGCDFTGDALTLIGVVRGLGSRAAFPELLLEAARLAGRHDLEADLRGDRQDAPPPPPRQTAPRPAPEPGPDYPPAGELEALWACGGPVSDDADASEHLVGRRIDPDVVARLDLARVLRRDMALDRLPRWARFQGVPWRDSGHRMLVRVWDAEGRWRSLRAWRVCEGSTPKRLPPAGCKAAGLLLANDAAVRMLTGHHTPSSVLVVEGEPDWVTRSVVNPGEAVLGVLSGSWHRGFAERIPFGAEVIIRTHLDAAGNRYAEEITRTVRDRAHVSRLAPEAA